jgi:hopene-associated glycosyltransferase HpnB
MAAVERQARRMIVLAAIALLAWMYLALLHGRFWSAGPVLPAARPAVAPDVDVVVPARDEAEGIAAALRSLLAQDFAGRFRVTLVDDGSTDGTGDIARGLGDARLTVIDGAARPSGWAGKLWAVHQGVAAGSAPYVLLTDADIVHTPAHLSSLLAQAERSGADLVSEMVELARESRAERWLVPAFVYFFQLLYPFSRVNDARSKVAAAAGGTVLIRRAALERIGGIDAIRGALIDDVALARAVKDSGGNIWLGHSALAKSVRPYPGVADIWRMIARSAYVQLRYSPLLLLGTVIGLALLFWVPPVALCSSGISGWLGLAASAIMMATLLPTLRRFRLSPLRALLLPAMATFYMAATVGSAIDHHRGKGVVWKRRAYTEREA